MYIYVWMRSVFMNVRARLTMIAYAMWVKSQPTSIVSVAVGVLASRKLKNRKVSALDSVNSP